MYMDPSTTFSREECTEQCHSKACVSSWSGDASFQQNVKDSWCCSRLSPKSVGDFPKWDEVAVWNSSCSLDVQTVLPMSPTSSACNLIGSVGFRDKEHVCMVRYLRTYLASIISPSSTRTPAYSVADLP